MKWLQLAMLCYAILQVYYAILLYYTMLCYVVLAEDSGEREGAPREDGQAEAGPADPTDAAHAGLPGPDRGAHTAAGAVCARQGKVRY